MSIWSLIIGMALIVAGIVQCTGGAASGHSTTWGLGLFLILAARVYEWMVKE